MPLSELRRKRLSVFAIFFTFFIDALSWSIVFPIFAPFFLNPHNHLFASGVSMATRTTILGFFLTSFSLGQFIGAPVLGEYGDLRGRKKALCASVFFTMVGFLITAWSMQRQDLYMLFAGRLITGLFASNMAICLAAIADLYPDQGEKAKYYGYLSAISGGSFVMGAFLGGKLSDPSIHPLFTPAFPFWIASALCVGNFLFVYFGFKETSMARHHLEFHFLTYFRNIKEALQTKKIKSIYGIYFLFLFAWTILLQFTPVLVVQQFSFTNSNIGDLALFMGVCWVLGSVYMNRILSHFFKPLTILEGCLLGFTALCALMIFPSHIYGVLIILAGCVMIGGLAWPICTSVISHAAPPEMQGKVLGMSQSTQSAAMALAPSIAGVAYQAFDGLPFLIGAVGSLAAGVLYFTLKDRRA